MYAREAMEDMFEQLAGLRICLSNLDKVLYPATGYIKGEMIDYYIRIAPFLVPHLCGRPVTRVRFPDGVAAEGFYEKSLPPATPGWVRRQRWTCGASRPGHRPAEQ